MRESLVAEYDPAWPGRFEAVCRVVEPALRGLSYRFEHVGSTAVPGMVAKPIIDLDVVINAGSFGEVKTRLGSLGYVHEGDLGIPGREAFALRTGVLRVLPPHHLYVCEEGSEPLHNHLAFRDFLRGHAEWRDRLSRHKRELAVQHGNDKERYIEGKAAMVEEITALALAEGQARGRYRT